MSRKVLEHARLLTDQQKLDTYAALLDVIEKAFTKSELFGDWGFRTRNGVFMEALPGVRRALAILEARIEEETG